MIQFKKSSIAICVCMLAGICVSAFAYQAAVKEGDKLPTKQTPADNEEQTVVINITCGPDEIVRLVTAFQIAEDALDDGRHVILLFTAAGVRVPVKTLSRELQLSDERPLWLMLDDIIRRGGEVLVARESARLLNLVDGEFIQPAQFGNWGGSVFSKMTRESVVFSF